MPPLLRSKVPRGKAAPPPSRKVQQQHLLLVSLPRFTTEEERGDSLVVDLNTCLTH